MSMLGDLLRRARLRGLKEGAVQRVRAESLENQAHDDAERFQDYGFAANPVDGQGLVLHVAGHTIVVRMDRLAERPQLAAHEVTVWHKEGHRITLKAGKLIQVDCDKMVVNAASGVEINTPVVKASAAVEVGTTMQAQSTISSVGGDVLAGGTSVRQHVHPEHDGPRTGPPA